MTKEEFEKIHLEATAWHCRESEDVEAELKRKKAMAFQAFMAYMDEHHPRSNKQQSPDLIAKFVSYLKSVI